MRAIGVVMLITIGIVAGAKLAQPVKRVEQKVGNPIRDAVNRRAPLDDLPAVIDAACPGIVALRITGTSGLPAQGIVLSADGMIATTAPVPPTARIEAWFNDGQRRPAALAAHDPLTGLSLLKVDGDNLAVATLGDADLPRIGGWGVLLTSPAGSGCMVEQAIVASDFQTEDVDSDYYLRIHGTGTLPPPGTPFLSPDGRVLALSEPGRDGRGGDHYLPIDLVTTMLSNLMRDPHAPPNPFGLIAEDLSPALADRLGADRGRGAVIVLVAAGSAADKAGLKAGDVILSAGQTPISSSSELARNLGGTQPIPLIVSRGGDATTLSLTLLPTPK
jgi:serine protease Do